MASLGDSNVDDSDIMTMVFDIFSSRTKFIYDFKLRLRLYFASFYKLLKVC